MSEPFDAAEREHIRKFMGQFADKPEAGALAEEKCKWFLIRAEKAEARCAQLEAEAHIERGLSAAATHAWQTAAGERDRLRAALEQIANTRCAWQLSQEIANEALARGKSEP